MFTAFCAMSAVVILAVAWGCKDTPLPRCGCVYKRDHDEDDGY